MHMQVSSLHSELLKINVRSGKNPKVSLSRSEQRVIREVVDEWVSGLNEKNPMSSAVTGLYADGGDAFVRLHICDICFLQKLAYSTLDEKWNHLQVTSPKR